MISGDPFQMLSLCDSVIASSISILVVVDVSTALLFCLMLTIGSAACLMEGRQDLLSQQ